MADTSPEVKSGRRLAREMEEFILRQRRPDGELLGSEADLMARFGVSRTILREAVRILEHDGLARMRRGPGGGLFATAPDTEALTHASMLWLRYNETPSKQLYDARSIIEPQCASWAAESIDEAGVELLEEALETERAAVRAGDMAAFTTATHAFHRAVALLSGNQVCLLFVQTMTSLTSVFAAVDHYSDAEQQDTMRAHGQIARAIIAGDGPMAGHRMVTHMRATHGFSDQVDDRHRDADPRIA